MNRTTNTRNEGRAAPAATLAPLHIVVADDNADTLLTLRLLLEDDGHVVRALASGEGVVDAVRQFKPDVCVLDIEMPGASGYAIAGEIRSIYGSLRPLMIAISGKWYRGSDRLLAMSCGFDHFLEKPADPRQLCRLLEDMRQSRVAAARSLGSESD
ncbi:MAG TPA: response regulator [Burkholderiales bacterium]